MTATVAGNDDESAGFVGGTAGDASGGFVGNSGGNSGGNSNSNSSGSGNGRDTGIVDVAGLATDGFLDAAGNAGGDESASEDSGNGGDSDAGVAGTTVVVGGFLSVDDLADDGADAEDSGASDAPRTASPRASRSAPCPHSAELAPALRRRVSRRWPRARQASLALPR